MHTLEIIFASIVLIIFYLCYNVYVMTKYLIEKLCCMALKFDKQSRQQGPNSSIGGMYFVE